MNWTYFIVYTNTKGLDTSSHNLVNPLQNNKLYGYTTVNNISMCMMSLYVPPSQLLKIGELQICMQ